MGVSSMVFGAFSKMINDLPVQAVIAALELECKMLENDKENRRLDVHVQEDTFSILSFGQFVRMAKKGEVTRFDKPLPPDHLEFYRETIVRLVNAGELAPPAMEQFANTFRLVS